MSNYDNLQEQWAEEVSLLLADQIALGGALALEKYASADEIESVKEWIQTMNPRRISRINNQNALKKSDITFHLKYLGLEEPLQLKNWQLELNETFELCLSDNYDWNNALYGLKLAYNELLDNLNDSSNCALDMSLFVTGGFSLGRMAAGDWIGGGAQLLKIAPKIHSNFQRSSNVEKRLTLSFKRWDLEVTRFNWSTFCWRQKAKEHLKHYFLRTFSYIIWDSSDEIDQFVMTLQYMITVLREEIEDESEKKIIDYSIGIETNTCPHCNISYQPEIVFCDNCQVGL